MITLSVLVYIVWTIARFHEGRYMGWSRAGYKAYGPWYAHLWDLAHWLLVIGIVVWICLKFFK